jgi:hypothetical protein
MKMHVSRLQKLSLGFLMSLGALISICAIARIPVTYQLMKAPDMFWESINIVALAVVE